jgi:enoyl-CoA hydratase/carnithine racemase
MAFALFGSDESRSLRNAMNFIRLEFHESIATVTLDHSGGNRINFQMREEMRHAFERAAASDARALIVRCEGPDFCLGGDI